MYLWNSAPQNQLSSLFSINSHFDSNIRNFRENRAHNKTRADHAINDHADDSRVLQYAGEFLHFIAKGDFVFFLFKRSLFLALDFGRVLVKESSHDG